MMTDAYDSKKARAEYNEFYKAKDFRRVEWAERGMISAIISSVRLEPGATVYDIGCGTGKYADIFSQQGFEVFGADLSEVGVRRADKASVDAQFLVADATVLPLRPGSADLVFCSGLSLFNEPDLRKLTSLIAGLTNLVRPGGYFVFVKTSMLTGRLAPRGSRFDHTVASIVEMLSADPRLEIVSATNAVPHLFALRRFALTVPVRVVSNVAAKFRIPSRITVIAQRRS